MPNHTVFVWCYEPDVGRLAKPQTVSTSNGAIALSKDLKKLGWKFIGPTTVYAFMQAMGLKFRKFREALNLLTINPAGHRMPLWSTFPAS